MFPDQNQPQPQPQPNPATQQPVATPVQVPPSPVQDPFVPPARPVQPPVQASTPVPEPVAPISPVVPPQPVPPASAVPTPSPVLDSSQIGYVPPAQVSPVGMPMSANSAMGKGGKGKFAKIRVVLAIVVALGLFSGVGVLLKDTLFTGSAIKVSDLQETTEDGITFKHPKQWTKIESGKADFNAVYTEGGNELEKSDQAVGAIATSLGLNYDSLDQSDRDTFYQSFKDSFEKSSVTSKCKNMSNMKFSKTTQPNYTDAYDVSYTCDAPTGRNAKGKFEMIIGFKGEKMHAVMVGAIDKTWDKSEEAFKEILSSFKPSN